MSHNGYIMFVNTEFFIYYFYGMQKKKNKNLAKGLKWISHCYMTAYLADILLLSQKLITSSALFCIGCPNKIIMTLQNVAYHILILVYEVIFLHKSHIFLASKYHPKNCFRMSDNMFENLWFLSQLTMQVFK